MKEISAGGVKRLLDEGKPVYLIDVREEDEFVNGRIPGSVNIPMSMIDERLHELDREREYILVCRSGNRSGIVGHFLENLGYRVINMEGGLIDWEGTIEK